MASKNHFQLQSLLYFSQWSFTYPQYNRPVDQKYEDQFIRLLFYVQDLFYQQDLKLHHQALCFWLIIKSQTIELSKQNFKIELKSVQTNLVCSVYNNIQTATILMLIAFLIVLWFYRKISSSVVLVCKLFFCCTKVQMQRETLLS